MTYTVDAKLKDEEREELDAPDAPERGRTLRERWLYPGQLIPVLVGGLFVFGRHVGMVASVPVWLLLGSLAFAWVASSVMGMAFPDAATLNLAVEIAVIVVVTYVIGWGALLDRRLRVQRGPPHRRRRLTRRAGPRSSSACSVSRPASARSRSGSSRA